jgi:hypothetical protein
VPPAQACRTFAGRFPPSQNDLFCPPQLRTTKHRAHAPIAQYEGFFPIPYPEYHGQGDRNDTLSPPLWRSQEITRRLPGLLRAVEVELTPKPMGRTTKTISGLQGPARHAQVIYLTTPAARLAAAMAADALPPSAPRW